MLFRPLTAPAPKIQFLCSPEDLGVIAPPVPAKTVLPDWFRKLPAVDREHVSARNNGLTIKRCMPFLDAMATGWILPLAATVRLEIKDGGNDGRFRMGIRQGDGEQSRRHIRSPAIRTSRGRRASSTTTGRSERRRAGAACSCRRSTGRTACSRCWPASSTPTPIAAHIHFPFFATGPDGVHVVEKGMPLVQVIPFRRADAAIDGEIRAETRGRGTERETVYRNTIAGERLVPQVRARAALIGPPSPTSPK